MSQLEKGNVLEKAVRSIESAILASSPAYAASTFRIEGKKIVLANGVHHEIDLYVTANLGNQYDAIFIFECKNWLAKVSKNEIIVFSEKIRATNAQKGFFVARLYTKDAVAQAELDSRIKLLTAEELHPSAVMVPASFCVIYVDNAVVGPVKIKGQKADEDPTGKPIDPKAVSFTLNGESTDLSGFIQSLVEKFKREAAAKQLHLGASAGIHPLEFSGTHVFEPGVALINDQAINSIEVKGTAELEVAKAVVISAIDVAGRGRAVTVQVPMATIRLTVDFALIP